MRYRIAVVDDDAFNLKFAESLLTKHDMHVFPIRSGAKLLDFLKIGNTADLVLLDVVMPEMDGFETLVNMRIIEREMNMPETPVIFLTAVTDPGTEMRGFQMGVSDFVHKPFDEEVLVQRILNVLQVREKIQRIEEEATTDSLTGLLNKKEAHDRISELCAETPGCLCMIDLDSFKLVNDIYGHEMGDRVLAAFAGVIRDEVPEGSVCGRIGGDEFLAFASGMTDEESLAELAANINRKLYDESVKLIGGEFRIPLGVSVGAVFVPEKGRGYDELFAGADKALYYVKNNGKHGYSVHRFGNEEEESKASEFSSRMNLKEVTRYLEERSVPQSAMWMGREAFGNVYRYMMRYMERYDIPAFRILFTLNYSDEKNLSFPKEIVAEGLRELIQSSLRNSDIMVQTGPEQFFLLLPELNPEHVETVISRVTSGWNRNRLSAGSSLSCEYAMVSSDRERNSTGEGARKDRIAVVDDSLVNLKMAEFILSKENMTVDKLRSGQELLDYLGEHSPDLILLDVNMPEMDGFETLQRLIARGGHASRIPVIFLTASNDDSTETEGFAMGAMDFIRKPFVPEILIMRVRHAINLIRLQNRLKNEVNVKAEENENLSMHIIQALAAAIDAKDTYTSGHSGRVAEYARMIASRYGYDPDRLNEIYMMALLHDVGKIGIHDQVINKKGKLDAEEFAEIKTHPVQGDRILHNILEMPGLSTGARWHHERFDGSGYPDGLMGDTIPEEARIIAVADSYDAMTSRRSYRDALPQNEVKSELINGRGTQFDPVFADIMLELMKEDPDFNMREH